MSLKEYLQEHGLSVGIFSTISKLSIPVIYRILRDENVTPKSSRRIQDVTQGKVVYENVRAYGCS